MEINDYNKLIAYLSYPTDKAKTLLEGLFPIYQKRAKFFTLKRGILYKKNNKNTEKPYRVISEDEVEDMLHQMHDNMGHSGINSTFERISALFYWPQMYEDICRHNTFCQPCQKRKPQTHRHELCLIQVK
jgi:hypothetical protein